MRRIAGLCGPRATRRRARTLRYAGSYQRAGELKKLLKEELAKVQKGWGEVPLARQARELDARFESLARSVGHHLDEGEPGRAERALDELAAAAAAYPGWGERANEVAAGVPAAELASALELEQKLDSLLKPTR